MEVLVHRRFREAAVGSTGRNGTFSHGNGLCVAASVGSAIAVAAAVAVRATAAAAGTKVLAADGTS